MKAQKNGYDSQIKNIDIIADETAMLDFTLNPRQEEGPSPVMKPTPEELQEWIMLYESAPDAEGTVSAAPDTLYSRVEEGGDSFILLPYLKYDPEKRIKEGIAVTAGNGQALRLWRYNWPIGRASTTASLCNNKF